MGKLLLLLTSLLTATFAGCVGDDFDVAEYQAEYTYQPFSGGQETPAHLFKNLGGGKIGFVHFDNPDVEAATGLWFTGEAFLARGCVGSGGITQAKIDEGYVHFHQRSAANWDQGHHTTSNPNTMGYWFKHVAASSGVDPMGIGASPKGEVYRLMPSHENAPEC